MIRPATPADLHHVCYLMRQAFPDDCMTPRQFLKELSQNGVALAVDDAGAGVLRGYLMTSGDWSRGFLVRQIVTAPGYQRQGVGAGLLATVPAPAAAWIREANTPSRGLFTSLGWELSAVPSVSVPPGDWMLYRKL